MQRLVQRVTLASVSSATQLHYRCTQLIISRSRLLPTTRTRTMSTSSPTHLTLSSGSKMPFIGLGLWKAEQGTVADAVVQAIKLGYRHFDSAADYGNEKQSGEGFKRAFDSGLVKREDLFITSKLWCTYHAREHVRPALDRILSDLQLEYIDLFLVHFPIALEYVDPKVKYPVGWTGKQAKEATIRETWEAMEALLETGKVKNIGISNFNTQVIMDLLRYAKVVPACNQIEIHPMLPSTRLVQYCQHHNIQVVAFSPLGQQSYLDMNEWSKTHTSLLQSEEVKSIGSKYGKTNAQVLLRWSIQRGVAAIPKSTNAERLKENLNIFDFKLSDEDMKQLTNFNKGVNVRFNDPSVSEGVEFTIWE